MSYGFTLLIILLVLVALGVTRWDLLRARWAELLMPPLPADPLVIDKAMAAPRHLSDEQLQHQAPHQRPAIHRSGLRS